MNDKYLILKILKENQIKIKEETYVSLSQQEIADLAHFSKQKTNKIINELIDNDYASLFNNIRGKYCLTLKGDKVIDAVKNSNL
jgi:predicted transcriptional regulator